jgi:hypothetical protein
LWVEINPNFIENHKLRFILFVSYSEETNLMEVPARLSKCLLANLEAVPDCREKTSGGIRGLPIDDQDTAVCTMHS